MDTNNQSMKKETANANNESEAALEEYYQEIEEHVYKGYLNNLTEYTIKELDSVTNWEEYKKKNIRLFKINKMVYEKDEFALYKFATALNSVSHTGCTVFVIMNSDGNKTNFYLGIKDNYNGEIRNAASIRSALKNALIGQFPGMECSTEKKAHLFMNSIFDRNAINVVSSVSCVGDNKDQDNKENTAFIQGLEKLALAAQGKEYTAIIIADSIDSRIVSEARKEYEKIYRNLSLFASRQINVGENSSSALSRLDLEGILPKGSKHKVAQGVAWLSTPINQLSILSAMKKEKVEKAEKEINTALRLQMAQTNQQTKSETKGSTNGYTVTIENKEISGILEKIDEEIKRFNQFESLGAWKSSAYFVSEMPSVAEQVAATYKSIVSGVNTGLEGSAINTWRTDENDSQETKNVQKLLDYLSCAKHPEFIDMNIEDKVDATNIVSSNELAIHMALPRHSVCGFPVVEHADFAKEVIRFDESKNDADVNIGYVFNMGSKTNTPVFLDKNSFTAHTFITGSTGSGKSNTIYKLIEQLNTNFLIIEPAKGEYKNVFGNMEDVQVYGTNPYLSDMLQINPFSFPKEIHIYEHIDRLVEIFNACWPMYAAMPAVLKEAIISAYEKCGWDMKRSENASPYPIYPTFEDVTKCVDENINESSYSADTKGDYVGSLVTRLNSLTNGINGMIFSAKETDSAKLFDEKVIVDLSRVGSAETKSLIMGILIMKLNEYRMATQTEMNAELKHITVLEEAHNILKCTSTEQGQESSNLAGKSVEMISNSIAEMRTYGEGFIIADQSPTAVDISAIKNTNTKIIMRLPEENDRQLAGKAAALKDEQIDEISKLPKGVAVVYQNDWVDPILCKIDKYEGDETLYQFDGKVDVMSDSKEFTTELLRFLISRGVRPFDIEYIKQALVDAQLSSTDKFNIQRLINEYGIQGTLSIWKKENFSVLAALITGLLYHGKVGKLLNGANSLDELNEALDNVLKNSTDADKYSDKEKADLFQCFLKQYSVEQNDNALYAMWRESIVKKGGIKQ